MLQQNGIRIIASIMIAVGVGAYLANAIAEATTYSVVQCVDYPAGIEAPNAGCHEVSNNRPEILKPFMNESLKLLSIIVSGIGAVMLVATWVLFRSKQMRGSFSEHA